MIQRFLIPRLREALADTPVVFVNGARQCGKSTLVQYIRQHGHNAHYRTFDDLTTLAAARNDPEGFIANLPTPVILDEVQRAPHIFLPIKAAVDFTRLAGDNAHGQFLLTGSANILLLPTIADSLAGRMEVMTLWGFAQAERRAAAVLTGEQTNEQTALFSQWLEIICDENSARIATLQTLARTPNRTKTDSVPPQYALLERLCEGGFPEVVQRSQAHRRAAWFQSYLNTILQRDIQDIATLASAIEVPRLLGLLAHRSATLVNFSELSRTLGMPLSTLKRYCSVLETLFLIMYLPAWANNPTKRLVKTPKAYLTDTGLCAHLLGTNPKGLLANSTSAGHLLETAVVIELSKHCSWNIQAPTLWHYRTQTGVEVDIILELPSSECIAIEVKLSNTLTAKDTRGIRAFAAEFPDRFRRGIVLYTGTECVPLGDRIWAIPVETLA